MHPLTLILAALIAGTHLAVIFWPRKPIEGRKDEEGRPILWCNKNEQIKDVTCVWSENSTTAVAHRDAAPAASSSNATTDHHRSAA